VGKATGKEKSGQKALQVAAQIQEVKELLIDFYTPGEIHQKMAEKHGLSKTTSERRLAMARQQIKSEINEVDRVEVVAVMMQQTLKIARAASDTRQLSNSLGALRIYGELCEVLGNHRVGDRPARPGEPEPASCSHRAEPAGSSSHRAEARGREIAPHRTGFAQREIATRWVGVRPDHAAESHPESLSITN